MDDGTFQICVRAHLYSSALGGKRGHVCEGFILSLKMIHSDF